MLFFFSNVLLKLFTLCTHPLLHVRKIFAIFLHCNRFFHVQLFLHILCFRLNLFCQLADTVMLNAHRDCAAHSFNHTFRSVNPCTYIPCKSKCGISCHRWQFTQNMFRKAYHSFTIQSTSSSLCISLEKSIFTNTVRFCKTSYR